ncbi:MAG TPA: MupA/Atu3671 family FMN-dependent luciferase-like monooxygenase [Longimicrobiaceae bacterium]|nr:MupA/Atu3671 family FMN-dependent luciferase-like monooxygenase [Longimicrobiaceae bacterium]
MQNIADVYRLSPRQHHLLASLATGGVPGLCVGQTAWTLRGLYGPDLVFRAWREAVARHPALRTAVFAEGMAEPVQVVLAEAGLPCEEWDWSALPPTERDARLAELAHAERTRGFDPGGAPLMRLAAVRLDPDVYRFIWTYSSLVLDDRSASLCLAEVLNACRGVGVAPRAPAPYRNLVAWLERQDATPIRAWWRAALQGFAGPTRMVAERGTVPPLSRVHQLPLDAAAAERLRGLIEQHRLEWDALLAAAWGLLLHAHTGCTDVTFGLAVPGRPAKLAGSEAMVGSFRNVVPFRLRVEGGATVASWLRGVQGVRAALRPGELASPEQLREWAGLPAGADLFESVVEAEVRGNDPLADQLEAEPRRVPAPDGHPLELRLSAGEEVSLRLVFDAHRLDPARAAVLLKELGAVLQAVAEAPGRTVGELLTTLSRERVHALPVRVAPSLAEEIAAVLTQHPAVERASVTEGGAGLVARLAASPGAQERDEARRRLRFSLFYFADAADDAADDRYRLLLEGARFADRYGFEAVWVPERHFHENGGLYPNPSLLAAALAPITRRVHLRAGSVALPLHHPLRVAEEWSVVDNLSGGRAGISVTSGWIPNDFALVPQNFAQKREVMFRLLSDVHSLWRGGTLAVKDGVGNDVDLRIFPRPLQRELPTWITCSGDPSMFQRAGELGHHCLTALLTQPLEEAAEKVGLYREARERGGHDVWTGQVTLMLHTFVGDDADEVLSRVREPLTRYLRSHIGLMETLVKSLDLQIDIHEPQWLDSLASFAFERYYRTGAFIGTPESCLAMVDRVVASGVDEVACLIDFGVDSTAVLAALPNLAVLRAMCEEGAEMGSLSLRRYLARRIPSLVVPVSFELINRISDPSSPTGPFAGSTEAVPV